MKKLTFIAASIIFASLAFGIVAIQDSNTQIKDSKSIILGSFQEDSKNQIIFVIEKTLKGEPKVDDQIIIDHTSRLAWRFVPGGGPMPHASSEEFLEQIRKAEWFKHKVILLGEVKDGKWVSSNYDWSVWTSGKSTREDAYKDMSLDELVEAIGVKLAPEKAKE